MSSLTFFAMPLTSALLAGQFTAVTHWLAL